jgi:hypothetical protein
VGLPSARLRELLRRNTPSALKSLVSGKAKARLRAILRIEPWPDLAIRHGMFRTAEFRALRKAATAFDAEKPNKPILERGHQTSYLLAFWLAAAGIKSAFHVGYASGRHVFYLTRMGIACAGTDLPSDMTVWADVPAGVLDEATRHRMLRVDFFDLMPADLRSGWAGTGIERADLLFSEATFETFLPWRAEGISVPGYGVQGAADRRALMHERFPAKLTQLKNEVRNMVFIEPEPEAGGAGAVFQTCARRLPDFAFSIWAFRKPFDHLFRLTPAHQTRQVIYAFTRDEALLEPLRPFAKPRA